MHLVACTIGIEVVHVVVRVNRLKISRLNVNNSYDSCISQRYTIRRYVSGDFVYNRLYLELHSLQGQSLFMELSVYQDTWEGRDISLG